jgi:hypothetical protein
MLIKKVGLIVYWSLALLFIGRWPYCILVVGLIVYWSLALLFIGRWKHEIIIPKELPQFIIIYRLVCDWVRIITSEVRRRCIEYNICCV